MTEDIQEQERQKRAETLQREGEEARVHAQMEGARRLEEGQQQVKAHAALVEAVPETLKWKLRQAGESRHQENMTVIKHSSDASTPVPQNHVQDASAAAGLAVMAGFVVQQVGEAVKDVAKMLKELAEKQQPECASASQQLPENDRVAEILRESRQRQEQQEIAARQSHEAHQRQQR